MSIKKIPSDPHLLLYKSSAIVLITMFVLFTIMLLGSLFLSFVDIFLNRDILLIITGLISAAIAGFIMYSLHRTEWKFNRAQKEMIITKQYFFPPRNEKITYQFEDLIIMMKRQTGKSGEYFGVYIGDRKDTAIMAYYKSQQDAGEIISEIKEFIGLK